MIPGTARLVEKSRDLLAHRRIEPPFSNRQAVLDDHEAVIEILVAGEALSADEPREQPFQPGDVDLMHRPPRAALSLVTVDNKYPCGPRYDEPLLPWRMSYRISKARSPMVTGPADRPTAATGRFGAETANDAIELAAKLAPGERRSDERDDDHDREERHPDLRPERGVRKLRDGVLHD